MMQRWQKKKTQFPVLALVFAIFILCSIFYNERYIHQIHQQHPNNNNNNLQTTNLDAYDNNPFNHYNHTLQHLFPGLFFAHSIHTYASEFIMYVCLFLLKVGLILLVWFV